MLVQFDPEPTTSQFHVERMSALKPFWASTLEMMRQPFAGVEMRCQTTSEGSATRSRNTAESGDLSRRFTASVQER